MKKPLFLFRSNYLITAMWVLFTAVACLGTLSGKPPAGAQMRAPSVDMSLSEWNQERIAHHDAEIADLEKFEANLDNYNRERDRSVETRLQTMDSSLSAIRGEERGGSALLVALGSFAIFFQVRRKPTKGGE